MKNTPLDTAGRMLGHARVTVHEVVGPDGTVCIDYQCEKQLIASFRKSPRCAASLKPAKPVTTSLWSLIGLHATAFVTMLGESFT